MRLFPRFQPGRQILDRQIPDDHWRSLKLFTRYRLIVGLVFIAAVGVWHSRLEESGWNLALFRGTALGYVGLNIAALTLTRLRRLDFDIHIALQVAIDVVCLTLLMHAAGGVKSGFGVMLLITIAAASLISRGRLALFYASLASIAVLFEQLYQALRSDEVEFFQAALVSSGYFAVAWLARSLAKYARTSEKLAIQRGIDLANLAQVNQLVIRDMHDGVLVVDDAGRIRSHNPQAENLFGWLSPDNYPRLRDYAPPLADQVQRWRANPATRPEALRSPIAAKHLQPRFVSIGEGEQKATVIFLADLTQQQDQAQQIKLAALGRLTASIAHEIRNPLSSIIHAAELLQEDDERNATGARLLTIIRDNAFRLDRMVQEVLHINRRDQAHLEAFAPLPYFKAFTADFCQVEKAPTSVFSLEIDSERALYFDRIHLHQVLWNLTRNAWRHCQKKDMSIRLCLSEAPMENTLQLDIIDDGPGIDPALQEQLFEPFFTTESQGTGLGLYIAREVCQANGASLDYIAVAPGGQFRILMKGAPPA